jgi:hypothetical protein
VELKTIAGLWRFPNRSVWIEVSEDGSLFQCRRPRQGALITSRGQYHPPNVFVWEHYWGTEEIEHVSGGPLTVHARFGVFDFVPSGDLPMSAECKAASQHGS